MLDLLGDEALDAVEAGTEVVLVLVSDTVSVAVRAEVGLVADKLEERRSRGKKGSEDRADPVDPEVVGELAVHDGRAERTRRVERTTSVVDREHLADEEREANGHGGDEGRLVLLNGDDEDGEDEHGGHEHLNEETLDSRRTAAKGSSSKEGTGGEAIGKSSAL
jgi:hypothetical protein